MYIPAQLSNGKQGGGFDSKLYICIQKKRSKFYFKFLC